MADEIRIGKLEHGGGRLVVSVEEGRNFRRVLLERSRFFMGEWQSVGKVHVYMGEEREFRELLTRAEAVMKRLSEVGFEGLVKERRDGREEQVQGRGG